MAVAPGSYAEESDASGASGVPAFACPPGAKEQGGSPPEHLTRSCHQGGKRHGPWRAWWPSGQRWRTGQFSLGKRTGRWTSWWPSGNKAYEAEYKNGLLQGPVKLWYPSGKKKLEGEYSFGRANGVFRAWKGDGTEIGQLIFDAGKIRPKSKGNPAVGGVLPRRLGRGVLSEFRGREASMRDAANSLVGLGRAPVPSKLRGEKAAAYEAQSEWLTATGHRLLRYVDAVELVRSDATGGIRVGVGDEAAYLSRGLKKMLKKAVTKSREFKKSSASASARHAMAANALRRLGK